MKGMHAVKQVIWHAYGALVSADKEAFHCSSIADYAI